jgi:hypothetical protein
VSRRFTSAHRNRRCPPIVRKDGNGPESAQRRTVRVVTSKISAISAGRRTSPRSWASARTSVGGGPGFAFRRAGCLRAGSALIRCRKALRISASSSSGELHSRSVGIRLQEPVSNRLQGYCSLGSSYAMRVLGIDSTPPQSELGKIADDGGYFDVMDVAENLAELESLGKLKRAPTFRRTARAVPPVRR